MPYAYIILKKKKRRKNGVLKTEKGEELWQQEKKMYGF